MPPIADSWGHSPAWRQLGDGAPGGLGVSASTRPPPLRNRQWFFHCHNLYHLEAGMARVFEYET
jgi:FtsP/CotA-like multicopper oxidase with cupredoxin domain